jgi:hypothetical protein
MADGLAVNDRALPKQRSCGFEERSQFDVSDLTDFTKAVEKLYIKTFIRKGGFNNSPVKPT